MSRTANLEWEQAADALLTGKRITGVRTMTQREADELGWNKRPVILILEGNVELFPSQDDEGNDAGTWFGTSPEGDLCIPSVR